MSRPHTADALSDEARLTSVSLSVAYTSGQVETRNLRGLGRLNWYRGSPRHYVTQTPLSRSKDQISTCRGRGILWWRPPAQLVWCAM